ncbi:hypothetical protein TPR58_13465 [Sphingomonas sp. HF-S3]|uniref:Baseplate protein J-like domain-containing protein n=1 Tax=Sphingomonas rustica TaxID=3103142 RepID=A0ABV0B9C5_9SPHN
MSGTDHDVALAGTAAPGFAIAPLATTRVSGSALVPACDDVGDGSDGLEREREVVFSSIDLTAWAAAALAAIDSLFLLDRAARIRAVDAARATALEAHRKALVEAIVTTLRPVAGMIATAAETEAARTAWRAALQLRLAAVYPKTASAAWQMPEVPAVAALDAVAPAEPDSIAAAARWSYSAIFAQVPTARDEFRVSILINDAEPAGASPPMPAPDPALFRALARLASAWPLVEPKLIAALNEGRTEVSAAALAQVDGLIGDLAAAWAGTGEREEASPHERQALAGDAQQSRWDYAFDFAAQPEVTATRSATTGDLPRWPAIDGFRTPAEDGKAEGRYTAVRPAPTRGLALRWDDLPVAVVQVVRMETGLRHDTTPSQAGKVGVATADPAFVLLSPSGPAAPPVVPATRIAARPFRIETDAATLSAALDTVIAALLIRDALPGYRRPDIAIRVEASHVTRLSDGDEMEVAVPILLADRTVSQGPSATPPMATAQTWRENLVGALVDWHDMTADQEVGLLRLAISLSLPDAAPRAPLLRIDAIDIPVPGESGDWWR